MSRNTARLIMFVGVLSTTVGGLYVFAIVQQAIAALVH